jgi:hypothetical protein
MLNPENEGLALAIAEQTFYYKIRCRRSLCDVWFNFLSFMKSSNRIETDSLGLWFRTFHKTVIKIEPYIAQTSVTSGSVEEC